jgi:hypothetical protein
MQYCPQLDVSIRSLDKFVFPEIHLMAPSLGVFGFSEALGWWDKVTGGGRMVEGSGDNGHGVGFK